MKIIIKSILGISFLVGSLFNISYSYADYPDKPINLYVAYKAGGSADALARQFAKTIEKQQGWKFIVNNYPGADGSVMATKLKYAKADGYTLGFSVSSSFHMNPILNEKSKYAVEDFTYVAAPAEVQLAVVALNNRGWKDLDDAAQHAKENGGLSIAAQAQDQRLAAERIAKHYGIEVQIVPTKGGAGSLAQVMGGHIDLAILAGPQVPYVKSGDMVELALLTEERSPYSPQTKTLKEHGIDWGIENYFQFTAPKGIPAELANKIFRAIEDAMQTPEMQQLAGERLRLGIERTLGPADLNAYILSTNKALKHEFGSK